MKTFTPQFRENAVSALIISMIPVTLIFMPRPPIGGAHYLVFPLVGVVCLSIIGLMIPKVKQVDGKSLFYLLACSVLLLNAFQAFSMLLFVNDMRPRAEIELLRPFLLFLFFVSGVYLSKLGRSAITRGLCIAGLTTLFGQALLVAAQYANMGFLEIVYDTEKFIQSGRISGSMQNPNGLAWIVTQSAIIPIYFLRSHWKWLTLPLAGVLIFLSGSRSQFLLFPFMIFGGVFIIRQKQISLKSLIILGFGLTAIAGLFMAVLNILSNQLSRMSELNELISSGGSLKTISSFAARLELWELSWDRFMAIESDWKWLLGGGPRADFRMLDNDYFYVFFKYGAFGTLAHFALIGVVLTIFLKCKNLPLRALGLQFIVTSLILGIQSEMLGGWFPPLLLFFYAGLALSEKKGFRENYGCD